MNDSMTILDLSTHEYMYVCMYVGISIFPKPTNNSFIHSSISNHTTPGGELFLFFLPSPKCPLLLDMSIYLLIQPGRPCFSIVSFVH